MSSVSLVIDFVSRFGVVIVELGSDDNSGSAFLMANTAEVLEVQSPTTKDLLSSTDSLEFDSLVFWMEMRYSWPYLVFFGHMGRFSIVISICFINNDYRHSEISTVLSVSLHCSGKDIRDPLQPVL